MANLVMRGLWRDAVELARGARGSTDMRSLAKTVVLDGFAVLALQRAREGARALGVPVVNGLLRRAQMALFGVEIGKDVELGPGVYCVHTLGIVIGGNAKVGARVRFMGNNHVGTAKDNGYPVIEDDVLVGCGARILGPVRVGARSVIGANAVVLSDIPSDSVAVGIPARCVRSSSTQGRLGEEASGGAQGDAGLDVAALGLNAHRPPE